MWRSAMESVSAGTSFLALGWLVLRSSQAHAILRSLLTDFLGSFATRGAHRSSVHASEGKAGITLATIRTSHLQAAMSISVEPILVSRCKPSILSSVSYADRPLAKLTYGRVSGSVPFACPEMLCPHITRTFPQMLFHPSCILRTRPSSTGSPALRRAPRFSYMLSICARRRIAWRRSRNPWS